jgi:hypothetical protein
MKDEHAQFSEIATDLKIDLAVLAHSSEAHRAWLSPALSSEQLDLCNLLAS